MIKILIKVVILVCIILSIFFIVNPSACSNLMSGRVVNSMEQVPTLSPKEQKHQELFVPAGDKVPEDKADTPANLPSAKPEEAPSEQSVVPAVTDTRSTQEPQPAAQPTPYTQEDADYAVASRYVELENEYLKQKKDVQKAAKEISYIVMDDFEMTPQEWEAFLQRATATNLFEKVRQAQIAK